MRLVSTAALLALLGLSCNNSDGGGAGVAPNATPASALESLERLGVATQTTARNDEQGGPLPEDYSPLGPVVTQNPIHELFLGGIRLQGSSAVGAVLEDVSAQLNNGGRITPTVLLPVSAAQAPWMIEPQSGGSPPATLREAVAADLDGDGIDEIVTAFATGDSLRLQVIDDPRVELEIEETTLWTGLQGITTVALAAGDFDGDKHKDLAVGYTLGEVGFVRFITRDDGGAFHDMQLEELVFPALFSRGSVMLIMVAGNLDYDDGDELVVLVNERGGNNTLASRFHVYDDARTGLRQLRNGFVEGFEPGAGLQIAAVADVTLGDVDGDHRMEILFAGLAAFSTSCDVPSHHVLIALDDAPTGFAPLGVKSFDKFFDGCANGPSAFRLQFVHINALDIDGDGLDEVQVNQFVYDDWRDRAPWTRIDDYTLPDAEILDEAGTTFDRSNSVIAVGDVTGDGRQDILIVRAGRHSDPNPNQVAIWGAPAGASIQRLGFLLLEESAVNPILVPVNIDNDTAVLMSDNVHRLAFLEPTVVAALAAPPCQAGIGQNIDVCQTTFGNTVSTGSQSETSIGASSKRALGFSLEDRTFTQSEFQVLFSLEVSAKLTRSVAYSLETTVNFTTGPNEDTVLFSTVPVDIYCYTIVCHPDAQLIGRRFFGRFPRDPILLQVERGFFNDSVPPADRISDSVFRHTIGDIGSYPTRSDKDELVRIFGGLQLGPQSVGQGAGQTEVELAVGREWALGGSLEVTLGVEATIVIGGAAIGLEQTFSIEEALTFTSGISTTYSGVVGSIPARSFLANRYSFGLFTYTQVEGSREFAVINYWVER